MKINRRKKLGPPSQHITFLIFSVHDYNNIILHDEASYVSRKFNLMFSKWFLKLEVQLL